MADIISLDLETTGIDWKKDKILLNGYRINARGPVIYADTGSNVDERLNEHLRRPENTLRGHGIRFDALFLAIRRLIRASMTGFKMLFSASVAHLRQVIAR
jgi:uncharacterized protein YprB with RNaseH-like and TPR domain